MIADKVNLLDLSFDGLVQMVVEWGQPHFRAKQIWHWLYHGLTTEPDEMVNLPKSLRHHLAEKTRTGRLEPTSLILADDGLTE